MRIEDNKDQHQCHGVMAAEETLVKLPLLPIVEPQPDENLLPEEVSRTPLTPGSPSENVVSTDLPLPASTREPSFVCGEVAEMAKLHVDGHRFVDDDGRLVMLRGVNLGGSSKLPTSPVPMLTHLEGGTLPDGSHWSFYDGRSVSFVGRPFPLAEADEHLGRLRAWGFNLLRLIITWEAVEHAGPGEYDTEYLDYIRAVIERAGSFGFWVYVDPHQDCWSRFTGGSGHPAWTLEEVGMDLRKLPAAAAAITHQSTVGGCLEHMIWPTNAFKYAAATMFTLFWAGNKYAPQCKVRGEGVQEWLQRHYIAAIVVVASRLKGLGNVIGFGTMNEPLPGFLGLKRLDELVGPLRNGHMPTGFEGMTLASGVPTKVGLFSSSIYCLVTQKPLKRVVLNGAKTSVWLEGRGCPWQAEGVWRSAAGSDCAATLLKPDYFAATDFGTEHFVPFAQRYAQAIRAALDDDQLIFVELPPAELGLSTFPRIPPPALPRAVNAAHWYDQMTLFSKHYVGNASWDVKRKVPALGAGAAFRLKEQQLNELKGLGMQEMGGVPTLIGECGIPYNLNHSAAYKRGDYSQAHRAMDSSISALEEAGVAYALWVYTCDHSSEWGDGWNGEDLSIYSPELRARSSSSPSSLHQGGRALHAVARPFAPRIAGSLVHARYDVHSRRFGLCFNTEEGGGACCRLPTRRARETEVFIPLFQYPCGFNVFVSGGGGGGDGGGLRVVTAAYPHPPHADDGFVVLVYTAQQPLPGAPLQFLLITPCSAPASGNGKSKTVGGKLLGALAGLLQRGAPLAPGVVGLSVRLPRSPPCIALAKIEAELRKQGRMETPAMVFQARHTSV